jgi:aminoglycoside phosphotransferase
MGIEFDSRIGPEIQELIKQQSKTWRLVFTHGDLSSLNILVRGDDNLVSLIGKLLVGIHHIGNTLLRTKSTHKNLFGSMRLTDSYNQCLKSWRWNRSVKNILEMFKYRFSSERGAYTGSPPF